MSFQKKFESIMKEHQHETPFTDKGHELHLQFEKDLQNGTPKDWAWVIASNHPFFTHTLKSLAKDLLLTKVSEGIPRSLRLNQKVKKEMEEWRQISIVH